MKLDANRLGDETSPYLLQHKDNPVHWQAWSAETLALAKQANRPILLSSGYAACHWCHVMAHESFEDEATAALMNSNFVNVKVDREERPDIDYLYQQALALLGQRGGWPLTMFLTPDGEPFWGGTYFPPTPRYGMPSFADVLNAVSELWRDGSPAVGRNAAALTGGLKRLEASVPGDPISREFVDEVAQRLEQVFDPVNGGVAGAPKFPQVPNFDLLWRAWKRTGRESLRANVTNTLDHICQGGIYDHLGGGFARYSTDERWLAPHFEKMLYDNAQLVELLTEVWLDERRPLYATRVEETIRWALRDMRLPEGGFASSLDADSEHEEGKFYIWTASEIRAALGGRAKQFLDVYGVTESGNWENGKSILNRLDSIELFDDATEAALAEDRATLFALREARVHPGRDDKALVDWNGLMIAAIAKAATAFDRPDWLRAARDAFDFVTNDMTTVDGRLLHSWRGGRAKQIALLDDYADLCRAALALFEATCDQAYLDRCGHWVEVVEAHYRDKRGAGYFFTADDAETLIARAKIGEDAPLPSGNATMLQVLTQLYYLTGDVSYRERADSIIAAFSGLARRAALGFSMLLNGAEMMRDTVQIVVMGARGAADTTALLRAAQGVSLPGRVLSVMAPGSTLPPTHPAFGKTSEDHRATAYVCRGSICSLPIVDPARLVTTLRER